MNTLVLQMLMNVAFALTIVMVMQHVPTLTAVSLALVTEHSQEMEENVKVSLGDLTKNGMDTSRFLISVFTLLIGHVIFRDPNFWTSKFNTDL